MALYLGSSNELKINMDNISYCLKIFSTIPILNGIKLLSSDSYILKDSNGLYLTLKEGE